MTVRAAALACAASLSFTLAACGGHAERTLPMRTALDQGQPRAAIAALNAEMGAKDDADLPKDLAGDDALLVLDRASIQQSLAQFDHSRRDFQAADKAIDMLDLARNAGDSIGEYVFSGSSGRYLAPPYEKLLINTLNMLNYLERRDLEGARVEARRLSVMQRYVSEQLGEHDNAVLGLGGFLAGFTYEKSGAVDEALRYYDEALAFGAFSSLQDPVRRLLSGGGTYTSPRLRALIDGQPPGTPPGPPPPADGEGGGEIVFVVGYGRVPHKIANRVPVGLALTYFADAISPNDRARANELAVQGLVTWINYPSLGTEQGGYEAPWVRLDGQSQRLEQSVDVSAEVRKEWRKIEGKIVASAITRLIARFAAGAVASAAVGRDNKLLGLFASIGTQATLAALDTPDTRSWETLPARVAVARVRVPAGKHVVSLEARGVSRRAELEVAAGGWALVSLMALR